MRAICCFVRQVFLLSVFASSSCLANIGNDHGAGPRWACWYSPSNLTVQCLLSKVPTTGLEARAEEVAGSIDRRLPSLVRTIWGSPEQLSGTRIGIPLMSVPFEMDFVRLLAKSVMCGTRADCSVLFDSNSDGFAPVRAAALESGANESEVMAELRAQGLAMAQIQNSAPPNRKRKLTASVDKG